MPTLLVHMLLMTRVSPCTLKIKSWSAKLLGSHHGYPHCAGLQTMELPLVNVKGRKLLIERYFFQQELRLLHAISQGVGAPAACRTVAAQLGTPCRCLCGGHPCHGQCCQGAGYQVKGRTMAASSSPPPSLLDAMR